MNETRIYADAFETTFANPKEMLDFLGETIEFIIESNV